MSATGGGLHSAWARLFIRSLVQSGVQTIVVSPGSRSTPLALAAAALARTRVVVDERSAAFFALGEARLTGAPVAVLCTSGTAGAHYLPAVIEASQSFLPLVVITADRPWELQDAAAPQTIDQVKLFGDHARWFAELGLPDAAPSALRAVPRVAAQAVARARGPVPGPVQVNARFRKPLEPTEPPGDAPPGAWAPELERLFDRGGPRVYAARALPDEAALDALVAAIERCERGVIVCGPAPASATGARAALRALAGAAGYPLLAEATSQQRFGAAGCGAFDAFLRAPAVRSALAPELALELWAPATSAGWATLVAERPQLERWSIAPHGWNDPAGTARALVAADPAEVARALAARLRCRGRGAYAAAFARAEDAAWAAVAAAEEPALTEGAVARAVTAALPEGGLLAIGNSSPVRDLDLFCPPGGRPLTVLHQRGASGIDGLVSGAAGARAASTAPTALLLGDLSLLHDLGGLASCRDPGAPLVIVAVQNDGGRIFEQLPLHAQPALAGVLQSHFVAPQGISFAHAAAQFGLAYERVDTPRALAEALDAALRRQACTVIEAAVKPGAARAREQLYRAVAAAAEAAVGISATQEAFGPRGSVTVRSSEGARGSERKNDSLRGSSDAGADAALPPLAFLHGFLGAPAQWSQVIAALGDPPARVVSLPGHGPDAAVPTAATFDAALDALSRALGPAPQWLVGYSLGARLALALALRDPARFPGAVLVGAHPGLRSADERGERAAWDEAQAQAIERDGVTAFSRAWERLPLFASQAALPAAALEQQRAQRGAHQARPLAWAMRTLGLSRMPSQWAALPRATARLHFVAGALDEKFAALAADAAQAAPRGTCARIGGAGHNLALEAPAALAREIRFACGASPQEPQRRTW